MTTYEQIEALVEAYGQECAVGGDTSGARFIDPARTALLAAVKALAEDVARLDWLDKNLLPNIPGAPGLRMRGYVDAVIAGTIVFHDHMRPWREPPIDAARSAASATDNGGEKL